MLVSFEFEGKTYQAKAQQVGTQIWIHFQGRTFVTDRELRVQRKGAGPGGASAGQIMAPMPGKITKLLVQEGHKVEAGAVLLVMEAMKMEYTLKAEVGGSVEKISCKVGDQVALGKVLVLIKEE